MEISGTGRQMEKAEGCKKKKETLTFLHSNSEQMLVLLETIIY